MRRRTSVVAAVAVVVPLLAAPAVSAATPGCDTKPMEKALKELRGAGASGISVTVKSPRCGVRNDGVGLADLTTGRAVVGNDLIGGPYVAPLLHALVVVRAHPGQQGQFLPPQPGDASPGAGFQADILRAQSSPAGAQELGEFASGIVAHGEGASVTAPVCRRRDS